MTSASRPPTPPNLGPRDPLGTPIPPAPDAPRYTDTLLPAAPPRVPQHGSDRGSDRGSTEDSGTAELAKQQAGEVVGTAKDAGAQVLGTAKEQAGEVTAEVGRQARQLLTEAQNEITGQASTQQRRMADGLDSFAGELRKLASGSPQEGVARDLVRELATKTDGVAQWLQSREPADVLNELRSFARRRPGLYLVAAAAAGLLVGRLTRGLKDAAAEDGDRRSMTPMTQPPPPLAPGGPALGQGPYVGSNGLTAGPGPGVPPLGTGMPPQGPGLLPPPPGAPGAPLPPRVDPLRDNTPYGPRGGQ